MKTIITATNTTKKFSIEQFEKEWNCKYLFSSTVRYQNGSETVCQFLANGDVDQKNFMGGFRNGLLRNGHVWIKNIQSIEDCNHVKDITNECGYNHIQKLAIALGLQKPYNY